MFQTPIRLWLPLLLFAALTAAAAGARALRPAPPRRDWIEVVGPAASSVARLRAKARVTADVIEGRSSLGEAVAAFKALDAAAPPRVAAARAMLFPGASEDEAYRRMVILWVRADAPPGRADELARRLTAEPDGSPCDEDRPPLGP